MNDIKLKMNVYGPGGSVNKITEDQVIEYSVKNPNDLKDFGQLEGEVVFTVGSEEFSVDDELSYLIPGLALAVAPELLCTGRFELLGYSSPTNLLFESDGVVVKMTDTKGHSKFTCEFKQDSFVTEAVDLCARFSKWTKVIWPDRELSARVADMHS